MNAIGLSVRRRMSVSWSRKVWLFGGVVVAAIAAMASPSPALTADQLLLITNKNIPEGHALAAYYAKVRNVPADRILDIPLPVAEGMTRAAYDDLLVPRIREYLTEHHLEDQVQCLVTFYGVPLRVEMSMPTPPERAEFNSITAESQLALNQISAEIKSLDALVASFDPAFKPMIEGDAIAHVDQALRIIESHLPEQDAQRQQELRSRMLQTMQLFGGRAALLERATLAPGTPADDPRAVQLAAQKTELADTRLTIQKLALKRHDPGARRQMRELVRDNFGLKAYLLLLRDQSEILSGGSASASAVDNELALLWWGNYRINGGMGNPLYLSVKHDPQLPRTLMVMRLDATQPGTVRDIINTSLMAEKQGLTGRFVIDARGMDATNAGYGPFDQLIRDTAIFTQQHTKVPVMLDNSPNVLVANGVPDMALYCGWYSVRNYVPPVQRILPGAVGYHVASFELISLRLPNEKGWVANLLSDGMAATMGAVAEPYLGAFPQPQQFFPLLMTGKLTMAEVYWRTTPQVSWMMAMIGDPLYKPFGAHPALDVADLPDALKPALEPIPISQPAEIQAQGANSR